MHLHHIMHCLQWYSSPRTDPSRDLVPDLYFRDTTWDSCDMHYLDYMIFLDWPCDFNLWSRVSCDLVIMLHDSYSSRTIRVHYIHVRTCMHGLLVHDLSSWLFLLMLLLSVLDTANHIVLIISMPYFTVAAFSYSLLLFFFLRVLLLVWFWQTFIIFQYL